MTLQSMTGFARIDGQDENFSWVWELRSVNGKGLDIRCRLPMGLERMEIPARETIRKRMKRGNIQASLQVGRTGTVSGLTVNHEIIDALIDASQVIQEKVGGELPTTADLLQVKGVVELSDKLIADEFSENTETTIMASLGDAVEFLAEARVGEGTKIAKVCLDQIRQIEDLVTKVELDQSRSPDAIIKKLKEQVEKLVSDTEGLDEQRLYQEAVILAAKTDVQEEIDRLKVHIVAARELFASSGPVGRKLDFLAQEFNRECNTICSKSNAASVTALGLDMKLVIDQFREQIQNME